MAEPLYHTITVHGKRHKWNLRIAGDYDVQEMRADGLEVDEVFYTIPQWVPAGWTSAWCRVQDAQAFLRRWLWF